ncbi:MAG: D-2-hydroxyacid dehydrogenase [Bacteroidales bacterium]|nr:D-2-hydroxyacid dehydrogenase [Bacteroidales bacterium]
MKKIVVLDSYTLTGEDLTWEELKKIADVTVYDRTKPEDTVARCTGADMVLTNKVIIDDTIMEQLPQMKYIGILATGMNVVDLEAAARRGIAVTNIPAYSTASVAQMVFAHLLNITQRVDHYSNQVHEGKWGANADFSMRDTPLIELAGKTIGLVGLGNTGMATAQIANAFGMRVIAVTSKSELPGWIESVSKEEMFKRADVVSLHCPLVPDTEKIINAQTLGLMKKTAIVINCGRGGLVDEDALADALKRGEIMAAGIDVMRQEPPRDGSPLIGCKNCYVTPHIAWATKEARERLMEIAVKNCKAFIEGK